MKQESVISTGELAKLTGVNRETIRFYERIGLLPPPERTAARYRVFGKSDLARIHFISNAKELGFTLAEIGELLAIADGEVRSCSKAKSIAIHRLAFVDSQLRSLRRLQKALRALVARCATAKRINGCPLIEALSKESR